MAIFDDHGFEFEKTNITALRPVGKRTIRIAIHDIDGTHSLIRDWPPVMSACLYYAITCDLNDHFDDEDQIQYLVQLSGKQPDPEIDEFCRISAGMSALTQMEWAIRKAISQQRINGDIDAAISEEELRVNRLILNRIWDGEELFDDIPEPQIIKTFIRTASSRLFKVYEQVLNRVCRDKNTLNARMNPEAWRVKGSFKYLSHLLNSGVKNFFVTGAVVFLGGGMYEEVEAIRLPVGKGLLIENLVGSSWTEKLPKDLVIESLMKNLGIPASQVLVVGDGRSEIGAGVKFGCVTMSRLSKEAHQQRAIHQKLGTNYIVEDFSSPLLYQMLK